MILHTVSGLSKSTNEMLFSPGASEVLMRDDTLLFFSEGVDAIDKYPHSLEAYTSNGVNILATQADCELQGVRIPSFLSIRCISYDEFVRLCVKYQSIQNWY